MNNEEKILTMLEALSKGQADIQTDMQKLKDSQSESFEDLERRMFIIEADVKGIKSNIRDIKTDVKFLRRVSEETVKDIEMLDNRTFVKKGGAPK